MTHQTATVRFVHAAAVAAQEVEMTDQKQFYTPEEVAGLFGVPRRTIVRMCANGKLPAARVAQFWRIPASALDQLRAGRQVNQPLRHTPVQPLDVQQAAALVTAALDDALTSAAPVATQFSAPLAAAPTEYCEDCDEDAAGDGRCNHCGKLLASASALEVLP